MQRETNSEALTSTDDFLWTLDTYKLCLKDWDTLNRCLETTIEDLADEEDADQIHKLGLRYSGLTLLRDVDNQ